MPLDERENIQNKKNKRLPALGTKKKLSVSEKQKSKEKTRQENVPLNREAQRWIYFRTRT